MHRYSDIKGIILAGGNGTRLLPLTKAVNKHLLPVGEKPMLQRCVEKMVEAKIRDILVVTGGEHLGGIAEFLGSGSDFDCRITFRVQDKAGGIAQALSLAEGFIQPEDAMCVILGDNMFESPLYDLAERYVRSFKDAMVVLKEVPDPERFGVPVFNRRVERLFGKWLFDGTCIERIEEKPEHPQSDFAVTGIYFYGSSVFDIIRELKPSGRGELEITDVNNAYIGKLEMGFADIQGWWTDAGTHESLKRANELVKA